MDLLMSIGTWLFLHQPPFPGSLIIGAVTFAILELLAKGIRIGPQERSERYYDDGSRCYRYRYYKVQSDEQVLGTVLLVIWGVVALGLTLPWKETAGSAGPAYLFHWISIGLGAMAFFARLFVSWFAPKAENWWEKIYAKTCDTVNAYKQRRAEKREARRLAREAARHAKENAPETVIAQCSETVKESMGLLNDKEIREAVSMVETLTELYALRSLLYQPAPQLNTAFIDRVIERADGIFKTVSLKQAHGELVGELREGPPVPDSHALQALQADIEGKIEAAVVILMSLRERIAKQHAAKEYWDPIRQKIEALQGRGVELPQVALPKDEDITPASLTNPVRPRQREIA